MSLHLLHGFARCPQPASAIALRGGDVFVTDNLLRYEGVALGIDHASDQRGAKHVVVDGPNANLLAQRQSVTCG